NRPPLAHAIPAGSVIEPQLGSSLSLSRLFNTTGWAADRLLELHMLAFYEMTPPGELTPHIRSWFKATCERVRNQALRADEPEQSPSMNDFNRRMALVAEGIQMAEQHHRK